MTPTSVADLAAIAPQAGRGGSEQGITGDADDGLDEGLPHGLGQDFPDRKDLDGAILLAGADCVAGRGGVGGSGFGGGGADDLKEARLVRLYLDEQVIPGFMRHLKSFFDSA
ncbi:MAG: hypothetical protein WCS42_26925 [Verrucomicrobiota bacterium]